MPGEAGAAVHTETAMAPGAGGNQSRCRCARGQAQCPAGKLERTRSRSGPDRKPLRRPQSHARLPRPREAVGCGLAAATVRYVGDLPGSAGSHPRVSSNPLFPPPVPAGRDRPIALVVERSLFDQECPSSSEGNAYRSAKKPFRLFSEQYIRAAKSQRRVQEPVTNKTELVDLLEYLREDFAADSRIAGLERRQSRVLHTGRHALGGTHGRAIPRREQSIPRSGTCQPRM